MAETIISGFHLLQLCGRDYSETVAYSVLENDLGEGYEDSVLFGADTGTRRFSIAFQNAPNYSQSATYELNGINLSPVQYLLELFHLWKTERQPVVIQSLINNQYYLCKFIDKEFTMQKAQVALFSGQPVFQQIRREGVSVFDMKRTAPWAWLKAEYFDGDFDDDDPVDSITMDDYSGNANHFGVNEAVMKKDQQNGKSVLRTNGTSSFLVRAEAVTIYQALMVIRINEATWSNNGGVLTAGTTNALLIGNGSGTKFFNIGFPSLIYKKNGIEYAQSDQQSPMEEFAIVYAYIPTGIAFNSVQIGKDRDFVDRFAAMDVGEVILWDTPQRASVIKEAVESLNANWAI